MDLPANLKAVGRAGAGVNNIPIERLSQQGVAVFNAPGANANAVKELVIAGMAAGGQKYLLGLGLCSRAGSFGGRVQSPDRSRQEAVCGYRAA